MQPDTSRRGVAFHLPAPQFTHNTLDVSEYRPAGHSVQSAAAVAPVECTAVPASHCVHVLALVVVCLYLPAGHWEQAYVVKEFDWQEEPTGQVLEHMGSQSCKSSRFVVPQPVVTWFGGQAMHAGLLPRAVSW